MPIIHLSSGLMINYVDQNSDGAPAIVLLHGLGANNSSWELQFPALMDAGYRIIAPDAPGFGQSSSLRGLATIGRLADSIIDFLNELQIVSFHLVGISMGGVLALQMALDYPTKIKKLVLVNTFANMELTNPRLWPYLLWRLILVHTLGLEQQAHVVGKRLFPRPEQIALRHELIKQVKQSNPNDYRAIMRSLARYNVLHRLSEIETDCLIITGECDTTVLPVTQKRLAKGIKNAQHVIIPNAGHAVSVENPTIFNRILLDFFAN